MARRATADSAGRRVHTAFTGVTDGDLAVSAAPAELLARREAVAAGSWTWLQQVHGAEVVVVERPGDGAGTEADAAVSARPGAVLAVHTADCAGVVLWSGAGRTVVGAAHAGWRGLDAGVLEATAAAMESLGGRDLRYRIGPCISAAAYEFGETELAGLVARYGPSLAARTPQGRPALDLRAGVRAALSAVGAHEDRGGSVEECTALGPGWFSWRARRDAGRQAALVWIEGPS